MPQKYVDVAVLEELRESGDYDKIAGLLGEGWQNDPEFDVETVRIRLLAAELAGGHRSRAIRSGRARLVDDRPF